MALVAKKSSPSTSASGIVEILLDLLSDGDTTEAVHPGCERLEALKRELRLWSQSRLEKSRTTDVCEPVRVQDYHRDAEHAARHGLIYSQYFAMGCDHAKCVIAGTEFPIGLVVAVLQVCPYDADNWSLHSANVPEASQVLANCGMFGDSCPVDRFDRRISPMQLREFYAGCITTLSENLGQNCYE